MLPFSPCRRIMFYKKQRYDYVETSPNKLSKPKSIKTFSDYTDFTEKRKNFFSLLSHMSVETNL